MWATLPIDPDPPVLSELVLITSPSDTMISEILHQSVDERTALPRANSCPQLSTIDESSDSATPRKSRHRSSSFTSPTNEQFFSLLDKQQKRYARQSTVEQISPKHSKNVETQGQGRTVTNSVSLNAMSEFDFDAFAAAGATASKTTTYHSAAQVILNPDWVQNLPISDSNRLNEGNSFLLFLCISILLYHRNFLLKQSNLDEQEISMHFDRFRRRHNAERILHCARTLYGQYVQSLKKKRMIDDFTRFSTS